MALSARTRPLPGPAPDLIEVAGPDGWLFELGDEGLAGRGVATRIDIDAREPWTAIDDILGAIATDDGVDRPGTGPVAFAALPFAPDRPASFVIPSVVVGRAGDGTRWLTTIADGDHPEPDAATPPPTPAPRPSRFDVLATREPDDWMALVGDATKAISDGALDKVVLAREVLVRADAPTRRDVLARRLRDRFPGCFTFMVDDLIGASPELLVSRRGERVRAHPMAGTAPRGGDPTEDTRLAATLLASTKDRAEHQITIDMVWDTLLPFCSYVDSEPEPSIVAVANVQHLASLVEGRLSSPPASVMELVSALHPTPAVAGWPVAAAVDFIAAHEGIDRGAYAGPVGWVDAAGNGTWAVGIRAALVAGDEARLFAGVGVVADSDPAAELAETDAKFQAVLGAIVRP